MKALLTIDEPLGFVDVIVRITRYDIERKYDCAVYIPHSTWVDYAHFDIKVINTGVLSIEINPN